MKNHYSRYQRNHAALSCLADAASVASVASFASVSTIFASSLTSFGAGYGAGHVAFMAFATSAPFGLVAATGTFAYFSCQSLAKSCDLNNDDCNALGTAAAIVASSGTLIVIGAVGVGTVVANAVPITVGIVGLGAVALVTKALTM